MRIAYVTNVRLPTERAHGHQIARVCDALAQLGHDVTIFAPYRKEAAGMDYWEFHNADHRVRLEKPQRDFDPINCWWIPPVLKLPILNARLRHFLNGKLQRESFDVIYTRTPALLPFLLEANIPVILELHTLPNRHRAAFVRDCNRCALVVCLTSPMRDELVSWGSDTAHVIVEGDAILLQRILPLLEKIPARKQLGFIDADKDIFTVGYIGSFKTMGLEKGVQSILKAVELIRKDGTRIAKIIVGQHMDNPELEQMRLEDFAPGTHLGFFDEEKVKLFYSACDCFIYPAPKSQHPFFWRDTSPLKLFEYMAAGKPIVTADLPPLHDILDESTAYFCKPGDPDDLARAIMDVLDHPDAAKAKAARAKERVQNHTWEKRMERIIAAFTKHA